MTEVYNCRDSKGKLHNRMKLGLLYYGVLCVVLELLRQDVSCVLELNNRQLISKACCFKN